MSLEVPDSIIEKYNIKDTSIVNSNRITWRMDNTVTFGNTKAVRTQDLVVLDIIRATKWQRPIYFAATCSDDSKIGLQDYLQTEGLAFRLTPVKDTDNLENVNEPILRKQLMDEPDGFSRTYQPGFKFRGLNDSTIFYDNNHLRMTGNYRNTYIRLALYYLNKKRDSSKVIETLDMMQKKVPRSVIPIDYRIKNDISLIYLRAGAKEKYKELAKEVIATALRRLEANPRDFEQYYNPYQLLITHYENLKEYDKALGILLRLQSYVPNEPGINALINKFKRLAKADSSEVNPKTLKEGSEN
jgi:tetratricopeptide (TPR) repeat protein